MSGDDNQEHSSVYTEYVYRLRLETHQACSRGTRGRLEAALLARGLSQKNISSHCYRDYVEIIKDHHYHWEPNRAHR